MKLAGTINRSNRFRKRTSAGQILAESVIGLSLIVFVWILVSYVNYMCNNRIRTDMAARFSAWLSGNGVDPTASGYLAPYFFMNNDTNLVAATSVQNNMSLMGVSMPS